MQSKLEDAGLSLSGIFSVPNSVNTITPLIGQILIESEAYRENGVISQLYIFHNKPKTGAIYEPVVQRLLPLDDKWRSSVAQLKWPTKKIPEALNGPELTLLGLIRQYLFISLFRSCAESLASENASRLAAMQRAEKNIDELLEELNRSFNRLRQSTIDEELFDVISGSEALSKEKPSD
jgi:F-type H+-transporting ATPase subunit gamma